MKWSQEMLIWDLHLIWEWRHKSAASRVVLVPVPVLGSSGPFAAVVLPCSLAYTSSCPVWLLLQLAFLLLRNLAISLVLLEVSRAAAQWLECRNTENFFLSKLRCSNIEDIVSSVDIVQTCSVAFLLKKYIELLHVSTTWLYLVCVTKI